MLRAVAPLGHRPLHITGHSKTPITGQPIPKTLSSGPAYSEKNLPFQTTESETLQWVEAPKAEAGEVRHLVRRMMTTAAKLSVPLEVDLA